MAFNRRKDGDHKGDDRREIVPLRLVEAQISYDTLNTLKRLERTTQDGDCLGIAFGAIMRGGKFAYGYTGAAIEQRELAAGILSRVIYTLSRDAEERKD